MVSNFRVDLGSDLCDFFYQQVFHDWNYSLPTLSVAPSLIACCGLSFRTSHARSHHECWKLLTNQVDTISNSPEGRWKNEQIQVGTKYGGFIDGVDQFDELFFEISPKEAAQMDPQQRLLLETAWETLEHAYIVPYSLFNMNIGVYIGVTNHDYSLLTLKLAGDKGNRAYYSTGNSLSMCSGRISYVLGLKGPSVSIDTACSSSLVAFHFGFQSTMRSENSAALVGGINLLISEETTNSFLQLGMLSPDGRCKTFDERANGYVRSEGCGIVLLKRLDNAIQDKNNVLAIIKGTAINQDGRSSGLTAPNGPSQQMVLKKALNEAQTDPLLISYIEAHGTGTSLGDPIEVQAICAVYCSNRKENQPLLIGSIKTNIGHTESAAGVAGLIKVILCLQHEKIPSNLHFNNLNPHIILDGFPVTIPTENIPWYPLDNIRIAAVSSFGFSGTNSHVIISEVQVSEKRLSQQGYFICTLSSYSSNSLKKLIQQLRKRILNDRPTSLIDNGSNYLQALSTVQTAHFVSAYRLAIVSDNVQLVAKILKVLFSRKKALRSNRIHFSDDQNNVSDVPAFVIQHSSRITQKQISSYILQFALARWLEKLSLPIGYLDLSRKYHEPRESILHLYNTLILPTCRSEAAILIPRDDRLVCCLKDTALNDHKQILSAIARLYIQYPHFDWRTIFSNLQ